MSQLFASGGQSIGVSVSTSVLPMNIQDWLPLRWTGWISLQSKKSQESSATLQFKSISSSVLSFLHPYMTAGKTIALTRWMFVGKVMSLLFNMLSRLVITFLPRSKCLLISRPFKYDLIQIPYDYTVEMKNRFKGFSLIERTLKNYGQKFLTLYRRQW